MRNNGKKDKIRGNSNTHESFLLRYTSIRTSSTPRTHVIQGMQEFQENHNQYRIRLTEIDDKERDRHLVVKLIQTWRWSKNIYMKEIETTEYYEHKKLQPQ